uniref:Uncharacterized protein n=1 Tax=uncultured Sphingobacterium sp. EB080_L08E11 TaxID=710992 RepID=E0Y0L7_9SPHI|nr:hypothetical protein [uncultured Sphingobacterium sp. EB080_L08E11]
MNESWYNEARPSAIAKTVINPLFCILMDCFSFSITRKYRQFEVPNLKFFVPAGF